MSAAFQLVIPHPRLALVNADGPAVWDHGADGRWRRTCHGRRCEVWRTHGCEWRRAMDGVESPRVYPSQARAMNAARCAAMPREQARRRRAREFGTWMEARP